MKPAKKAATSPVSPKIPASTRSIAIRSIEELHRYVRLVLCEHEHLDPATTPLNASPVLQQNRLCGCFFHVIGPRMVKLSAVWAAKEQRLLFYDSSGTRFAEVRLTISPSLDERVA